MRVSRPFLLFVLALAAILAGCSRDKAPASPAEPTKAMRAEAAHLLSEAEFAVKLRDYARAEPLLTKAVSLIGDDPDHWITLGATRRRLGNLDGARKAYREALTIMEREYRESPADVELVLQQVYVHALLGQVDQARALLDKAARTHAAERELQEFIRANGLDQLLNDRAFREIAL